MGEGVASTARVVDDRRQVECAAVTDLEGAGVRHAGRVEADRQGGGLIGVDRPLVDQRQLAVADITRSDRKSVV